jgi:C1A family cysteine protease
MPNINLRGFREEPDSPKHWGFEDSLRARLVLAPGDVDLRQYTSPRHDQRSTSSCVAQAAVKALEIKRIMEKGADAHVDLSRMAVYWFARNMMSPKETNNDGGTYISYAFDAIRRFGVPPEKDWPWDTDRIYDAPSWSAMRKAYVSKISAFYKIKSRGNDRVDMVIEALQAGNPVVFGTDVNARWTGYRGDQPGVLRPVDKDQRTGRHATCLVGFADGKFIGENSWGDDWGLDGFYLMDPDVIAHKGSADFWVPIAGWETYREQTT